MSLTARLYAIISARFLVPPLLLLLTVSLAAPPGYAQDAARPAAPLLGASHILDHGTDLGAAFWGADGTLWSWGRDGRLKRWNLDTPDRPAQEFMLSLEPEGLALHPQGDTVAVWNQDTLALENLAAGTRQQVQASAQVNGLRWSNDGALLWVWQADGVLMAWDATLSERRIYVQHPVSIARAVFSLDERWAWLYSWQGVGGVVDFERQVLSTFNHDTAALVGALDDPVADWLSFGWEGQLRRWQEGQTLTRVDVGAPVWAVQGDAVHLFAITSRAELLIFSRDELRLLHRLAHEDRILSMTLNTEQVLTTTANGGAYVWDSRNGEALWQLFQEPGAVESGGWHPNAAQILTWGADGKLRVFSIPAAGACVVTAPNNVNRRAEASTQSRIEGSFEAGRSEAVIAQEQGADGFVWFQLAGGGWVREDVVAALPACGAEV